MAASQNQIFGVIFYKKLLLRVATVIVKLKIVSYSHLIMSIKKRILRWLKMCITIINFVTFRAIYTSHKLVDSCSQNHFFGEFRTDFSDCTQVEATGPGNGRFPRIPAISRKQYSGPGNLRIFPVNSAKFLLVPAGNHRKSPGKSGEIRPGILLPGSGDIRRFPARSGAFPACFWPVPIKSAHFRRPETSFWAHSPCIHPQSTNTKK